jgi:hypothetical protein
MVAVKVKMRRSVKSCLMVVWFGSRDERLRRGLHIGLHIWFSGCLTLLEVAGTQVQRGLKKQGNCSARSTGLKVRAAIT